MVDPRKKLVLIRQDGNKEWQDRTEDVDKVTTTPSGLMITFRGPKRDSYQYRSSRAVVCSAQRSEIIPSSHRLIVSGALWGACQPEIVEFDGPDSKLCKIFRIDGSGTEKSYLYPAANVRIIVDASEKTAETSEIFSYFHRIAEAKKPENDPISHIYKYFDFVHPDSVLAGYLSGKLSRPSEPISAQVLPFQSNLSQQEAISRALAHNVSIIEGPPGTGKTETILNLIANIIVEDRGTVATVSFSNAAVANVGEKLTEYGFGQIVAELGNKQKREAFFAKHNLSSQSSPTPALQPSCHQDIHHLNQLNARLRELQTAEREHAKTQALLAEYELEQEHFKDHLGNKSPVSAEKLPLLRQPPERILEFLAETALETKYNYSPGVLSRIRKFFKYGRMRDIDTGDIETVLALQSVYYQRRITDLRARVDKLGRELDNANFETLTKERMRRSRDLLTSSIAERKNPHHIPYSEDALKDPRLFSFFKRDYPVILSTCHSIRNNVPKGYLFDFLIIDEASQVDLLSASLAMSVCRNLIIVGDRKQLAPISKVPDTVGSSPLPQYDYGTESILSSIGMIYGDRVPSTLLREHYRCHPKIIGFCNQAFYDGELIPYTRAEGRFEPAMRIQPTAPGNHMRQHRTGGKSNQRELDVALNEVLPKAPPGIEPNDIALAAPYRQQVNKANAQLNDQIHTIDTVHKLQGRQMRMVTLTTVLSETRNGHMGLPFVDDPRLINVAVSRAVDAFVLVTNFDRLPKSRHIRDLIGYIKYQYPNEVIQPSTVVSAFDLLYKDYDAQLIPLAAKLRSTAKYRSEEIVRVLLDNVLREKQFAHLSVRSQVFLKNLVPPHTILEDKQAAFVRRTSSVDFVIYSKLSKTPLLAIEVDGFAWHENNPEQLRRDKLKDSILDRINLPCLRLSTTGSNEEDHIRAALSACEE